MNKHCDVTWQAKWAKWRHKFKGTESIVVQWRHGSANYLISNWLKTIR